MARINLEDVQGLRPTLDNMKEDREELGKALKKLREVAEKTNSAKFLKTVESVENAFRGLLKGAESYDEKTESLVKYYEHIDEVMN